MKEENQLKIFAYGILRKRSRIKMYLNEYELDKVRVEADTIEGYVAYHSGSINMLFPVREKQKNKYPDAPFIVYGSTVTFYGKKKNLEKLEAHIDAMEAAYTKTLINTEKKENVIVYLMEQEYKQIYNLYGIGLIVYPDSVTSNITFYGANYTYEEDEQTGLKNLFGECC